MNKSNKNLKKLSPQLLSSLKGGTCPVGCTNQGKGVCIWQSAGTYEGEPHLKGAVGYCS
jgi:hypothetical protein